MINRRRLLEFAGGALALPLTMRAGLAQKDYPDRPIRVIIPRSGSGSVDVIGRAWSNKAADFLGPTYADNMGGGGGRIGATAAARAPADGYTLLIGTTSEMVLNPLLEKLDYDAEKDFTPIGILSKSPLIIAVNPKLPVNNLKELVAYAKANPGKVSFGSAGTNTIGHVAGEMFKQITGLNDIVHVPYKGGAGAILDVAGGRLDYAIPSISGNVVAMHREGKIRIIAVTSDERVDSASELASVTEQGFPGMVTEFFIGLFAPSGIPNGILDKIESATVSTMTDKKLRMILTNSGFQLPKIDRAEATAYVEAERKKWGPVLKAAGMKGA